MKNSDVLPLLAHNAASECARWMDTVVALELEQGTAAADISLKDLNDGTKALFVKGDLKYRWKLNLVGNP